MGSSSDSTLAAVISTIMMQGSSRLIQSVNGPENIPSLDHRQLPNDYGDIRSSQFKVLPAGLRSSSLGCGLATSEWGPKVFGLDAGRLFN